MHEPISNSRKKLKGKLNKDEYYLSKRIEKHKNILKCINNNFDISRRLGW